MTEAPTAAPAPARAYPPQSLLQVVNGRMPGFPVFAAAVAETAGALAAADARVAYLITGRWDVILRDPAALVHPVVDAPHPGRNVVVVLDFSNEGVALPAPFFPAIERMAAVWGKRRGGRLGVVLVQTSVAAPAQAARVGSPVPLAFAHYHHHAMTFLRTCVANGYWRDGLALLDREGPLKAFLCLNNTPRLHRLMAIEFLARALPGDHRTTFAGFDRSKIDWRGVVAKSAGDFPAVDVDALVAAIDALDVPALTDPSLSMHALAHEVEPETYRDTFASLVTETEMSAGTIRRYTEKILKPLVMGHPFVVAGNVGTLPLVEELGFDVLRDAVDQSYDARPNPGKRFDMMTASALELAALDQDGRRAFLRRHRDRLGRNVEQFDGRLLAAMDARFTAEIAAAVGGLLPHLAG